MHLNLNLLHHQLVDFGLNPSEWILEFTRKSGDLFHLNIRHQTDHDLILNGWAVAESWLELSFQG
jgi:hypothetical protein